MHDTRTNWPEPRLHALGGVGKRYDLIPEAGGETPSYEDEHLKRRKGKGSKDALVISSFDKERLTRFLQTSEFEDLRREIERGAEVRPEEIPPDVVTMNSRVRVTDVESGASNVYTIVFPSDADSDKGNISILAPLGTALLGNRVGDIVQWHLPRGDRRLRIEEIVYQPEAAGDFHL